MPIIDVYNIIIERLSLLALALHYTLSQLWLCDDAFFAQKKKTMYRLYVRDSVWKGNHKWFIDLKLQQFVHCIAIK